MSEEAIICPGCGGEIEAFRVDAVSHSARCPKCSGKVYIDAEGKPIRGGQDTEILSPLPASAPRPPSQRKLRASFDEFASALAGAAPTESAAARPALADASLAELLATMSRENGSDLHLKAGAPPMLRVYGVTRRLPGAPLTAEAIETMVAGLMSEEQRAHLASRRSLDLARGAPGEDRFRFNIFYQRASLSLCIRRVANRIPTLEELHLPTGIAGIADLKNGLAFVSGPTGSGKSTTLAVLVGLINQRRGAHVITIEDPIEFTHVDEKSFITQREIGIDVPDFLSGLTDALRQDPDVILIGELRDQDTTATALQASETGHLVLSTLHGKDTIEALQRLTHIFPRNEEEAIREHIGRVLKASLAQKMIAGCRPDTPRVVAVEFLKVNDVVRQCITDGEFHRIPNQMETYVDQGMQDFNMSLLRLIRQGLITPQVALAESPRPKELQNILGKL